MGVYIDDINIQNIWNLYQKHERSDDCNASRNFHVFAKMLLSFVLDDAGCFEALKAEYATDKKIDALLSLGESACADRCSVELYKLLSGNSSPTNAPCRLACGIISNIDYTEKLICACRTLLLHLSDSELFSGSLREAVSSSPLFFPGEDKLPESDAELFLYCLRHSFANLRNIPVLRSESIYSFCRSMTFDNNARWAPLREIAPYCKEAAVDLANHVNEEGAKQRELFFSLGESLPDKSLVKLACLVLDGEEDTGIICSKIQNNLSPSLAGELISVYKKYVSLKREALYLFLTFNSPLGVWNLAYKIRENCAELPFMLPADIAEIKAKTRTKIKNIDTLPEITSVTSSKGFFRKKDPELMLYAYKLLYTCIREETPFGPAFPSLNVFLRRGWVSFSKNAGLYAADVKGYDDVRNLVSGIDESCPLVPAQLGWIYNALGIICGTPVSILNRSHSLCRDLIDGKLDDDGKALCFTLHNELLSSGAIIPVMDEAELILTGLSEGTPLDAAQLLENVRDQIGVESDRTRWQELYEKALSTSEGAEIKKARFDAIMKRLSDCYGELEAWKVKYNES